MHGALRRFIDSHGRLRSPDRLSNQRAVQASSVGVGADWDWSGADRLFALPSAKGAGEGSCGRDQAQGSLKLTGDEAQEILAASDGATGSRALIPSVAEAE